MFIPWLPICCLSGKINSDTTHPSRWLLCRAGHSHGLRLNEIIVSYLFSTMKYAEMIAPFSSRETETQSKCHVINK